MMAYRASVHETTNCTPNLLMTNRETNLPIDLMVGSPPETLLCPVEYVECIKKASQEVFELVEWSLRQNAERQIELRPADTF